MCEVCLVLLQYCNGNPTYLLILLVVAVAGLPTPRDDHAVAMTRFATASLKSFERVMRQMEIRLGPDCSDLSLRIGIHS